MLPFCLAVLGPAVLYLCLGVLDLPPSQGAHCAKLVGGGCLRRPASRDASHGAFCSRAGLAQERAVAASESEAKASQRLAREGVGGGGADIAGAASRVRLPAPSPGAGGDGLLEVRVVHIMELRRRVSDVGVFGYQEDGVNETGGPEGTDAGVGHMALPALF